MRPWVAKTVTELVGFEDDIVVEYAMGLLEDPDNPVCHACSGKGYLDKKVTHLVEPYRHLIQRRCRSR
jgi:hypothetical protein